MIERFDAIALGYLEQPHGVEFCTILSNVTEQNALEFAAKHLKPYALTEAKKCIRNVAGARVPTMWGVHHSFEPEIADGGVL